VTGMAVNPLLLRAPFAVSSVQAGGDLEAVSSILGLTGMASLKRYEQLSTQRSQQKSISSERWPFHKEASGRGPLRWEEGTI
jgi:site-specific recombinase XerD